jgi:hypothetical protein
MLKNIAVIISTDGTKYNTFDCTSNTRPGAIKTVSASGELISLTNRRSKFGRL